jgi:hypothetical protein
VDVVSSTLAIYFLVKTFVNPIFGLAAPVEVLKENWVDVVDKFPPLINQLPVPKVLVELYQAPVSVLVVRDISPMASQSWERLKAIWE